MSQVNKFLYDVPIFNPSNFSYATSTLKMAQPAINNGLIYYKSDGLLYTQSNIVNVSGNIGIGTPSPAYKLDVNGNTNILGNEYVSGNLGVGTTAPAYKLDVNGNTRISGNIGIGTIPSVYKLNVLGYSSLNGDILTTTGSLEYPPQALTGLTTTISSSSYSNGTYNVIASSTGGGTNVYNSFDKNPSTYWLTANNLYSNSPQYDTYVGGVTTTYDGSLSYAGEYIQIQLPQGIRLISYSLQSVNFASHQTPKDFAVFGSFDGSTWSLIGSLIVGEVFSQAQIKTYNVDTSYSFNYFRLAINKRQGNMTSNYYADLSEWRLYGVQSTATLCTVYENVGIGTSTPSAKLHINDTSNDVVLYSRATNPNKNSILRLHASYDGIKTLNGNAIIQLGTKSDTTGLNADNSWYIGTHSSAGNNDFDPPLKIGFKGATWGVPGDNDFVTIQTNGNISIGDLNGQSNFNNILTVAGSLSTPSTGLSYSSNFSVGVGVKVYPPQAMTMTPFTVSNSTYANGQYTTIASSTNSADSSWKAFNKVVSNFWKSQSASYDSTTGIYSGLGSFSTNGYTGDFLEITFPLAIVLKMFTIQSFASVNTDAPRDFKIFGTNDTITYTEISAYTGEIFTSGQAKSYYLLSNTTSYSTYRMAINGKQTSGSTSVVIAEWYIYGSQTTASPLTVTPEAVAIGTTTPSAKLHIVQSVDTSPSFRVDDQTNDTTPFIIDASGAVGIQTATPNASAILDITSTSKGLLLPRITTMNDITSPAEGLLVYDGTAKQLAYRNATAWVNLSNVSSPRVAEIYYDSSSANTSTISLADTASFYRIPFSSAPIAKTGSSDFEVVASTNFICIKYTGTTTTKLATHYITVSVKLTNDAVSLRMRVYKNPTISLNTLSGTVIISSLQETYLATNEKFYNIILSFTDAPTNGDIYYVGAQGSLVTTLNGRSFTWVTTAY